MGQIPVSRLKIGKGPWCGTDGGYTNHECRCRRCVAAHNAYHRADKARRRAELYARGLTSRGTKRTIPYTRKQLADMREHGLKPDKKFMP